MNATLKILGLGRCAIGLLRRNLLKDQESNPADRQQIVFDHHYFLNPYSCTQSNVSDDTIQKIGHHSCTPTFEDQFYCLDRIDEYQVCTIEIFPPSQMYFHKKLEISACFESFTTELQKAGFEPAPPEHLSHLDPETYIFNLSKLIESIQRKNKLITIILLNAELLYDQAGKQLSSPLLHEILDRVKRLVLTSDNTVSLLDMNDVLLELSEKNICFFETEYPLLYIRHRSDLEPIEVARDCKHASPLLRHYFTLAFCRLLGKNGYAFENLKPDVSGQQTLSENYDQRATVFLSAHTKNLSILFRDSRLFSQYVGYVLATQNTKCHENVQTYIQDPESFEIRDGQDLVAYLYHIRTLTAYLFETKKPLLTSICLMGMRVLSLPESVHNQYSTYVLLWIKNICLAARQMLQFNQHVSAQPFRILLEKLKGKKYLHTHEVIRQVLSFEKICESSGEHPCRMNDTNLKGSTRKRTNI